ncbi:MAG: MBL fold metallo-hydrolase [Holophagaceae bacterium]|nr:MBL fold metallo-hydrolase [Holophagaceae bacterium]
MELLREGTSMLRRLLLTPLLGLALLAQAPAPASVTVAVHGAAGEVDGSLTVVRSGKRTYLVDCGVHLKEDPARPGANAELPVEAARVDGVFITHAHSDHMGRLPLLVRRGFRGPIHTTRTSELMLAQALPQAIGMDKSATRLWTYTAGRASSSTRGQVAHFNPGCNAIKRMHAGNKAVFSGTLAELDRKLPRGAYACRECSGFEAKAILDQVKGHSYGERLPLDDGGAFTLLDAGHIPGSASVLLELGGKRLLFSGDLGHPLSPLQAPAQPAPAVDAVWVESTYGGQSRGPEVAREASEFIKTIAEGLKAGGIVWIPAYALDRTQKVLYLIRRAQALRQLPFETPVYVPSRTALAYTVLYEKEAEQPALERWFKPEVYKVGGLLPGKLEAKVPADLKGPCILITTTFALDEPDDEDLVANRLADPTTRLLLVGYSDPEATGGQLKKIAASGKGGELTVGERTIQVQAGQVRSFRFLSGHLDAGDLAAWLSRQDKDKVQVTCVHGEPEGLKKNAETLRAAGFRNVAVAERGLAQAF